MAAPLIYLFGYPGVGKNTIARAIEAQSDFIAIHNHLLSNGLRHVVSRSKPEDYTRIEPHLHHHTMKAWLNFLEFVQKAVPDQGLVMTSVLYQNDPDRVEFFEFMRNWAKEQNRAFYPVRLLCDEKELAQRIQSPNRSREFKLVDTNVLHAIMAKNQILKPENVLTLDITDIPASESAALILKHVSEIPSS